MITFRMNGLEVQAEEGSTLIDAAHFYGLEIPTLCHNEGLTPFGGCRLCVVEIGEGLRILDAESRVADGHRVVAVRLDQVEEVADVPGIQPRLEEQIHPAVLQHVAEVAVAFGERRVRQQEVVVVPLQIAVLAAEQVQSRAARHHVGKPPRSPLSR